MSSKYMANIDFEFPKDENKNVAKQTRRKSKSLVREEVLKPCLSWRKEILRLLSP
jgi:hypothetical protein